MSHRRLFLALAATCLPWIAAVGQDSSLAIRILVADSAHRALANADVQLLSATGLLISESRTDSSGVAAVKVPAGSYRLSIRRLGYASLSTTLAVSAQDRELSFLLHPAAVLLPGVSVTRKEELNRRLYHIDAEVIASSHTNLMDSFDIISKLRPDIVWGRGDCGGASYIWVNGVWIPPEIVLPNDVVAARARGGGPASRVSRTVLYVLSMIPPDAVADMTYLDCRDVSMPGLHGHNALFVVLKPGIAFDPGRGISRASVTP